MTKIEKLAAFDKVQAECSRYVLAMHDLANHKFSFPVIEREDWETKKFRRYKVQMSNRAMPLFLVTFQCAGQSDQITVLDEAQIRDAYRDGGAGNPYISMLMRAVNALMAKQYQKELVAAQIADTRKAVAA